MGRGEAMVNRTFVLVGCVVGNGFVASVFGAEMDLVWIWFGACLDLVWMGGERFGFFGWIFRLDFSVGCR